MQAPLLDHLVPISSTMELHKSNGKRMPSTSYFVPVGNVLTPGMHRNLKANMHDFELYLKYGCFRSEFLALKFQFSIR